MKVFLGNPPFRKEGRVGIRAGSRWPATSKIAVEDKFPVAIPFPFFLAYAAALLEKNNIKTLLIDAIAEGDSEKEFFKKIKVFKPDLVVIETSTPSFDYDLKVARKIKDKFKTLIALVGTHVSVFPKDILGKNKFLDFVLIGEYEETLLDLIKHLEKKKKLKTASGLAYREGKSIIVNPRRSLLDINKLPWPARHLLPMKNYNAAFAGLPTPNLQMVASRGCPFHCDFCLWPQVMYPGGVYRPRDPVDVVDEIEFCLKEYPFLKSVYFDDDTFDIGKERMMKLAREIKKRKLDIPWGAMARADTIDKQTLKALKASGLCVIKYGVESGVQEVLDKIGKNLKLDKVEKTVKFTKDLGVKVHLTFALGLMGDSKKTIKQTIDYAIKLNPDSAQFSVVTPFPGTKYYETLKKQNSLLKKRWSDFDGTDVAVFSKPELSARDLEELVALANRKWKLHFIKRNIVNLDSWKLLLKKPLKLFYFLKG